MAPALKRKEERADAEERRLLLRAGAEVVNPAAEVAIATGSEGDAGVKGVRGSCALQWLLVD